MSKVAITHCKSYDDREIKPAVKKIFELLSLKDLIKPGMKVLLKPNLLANFSPEKGATTHPTIVKAVAEEIISLDALPFVGDSPGGMGTLYEKVLLDTGMKALNIPIVNFDEKGMRKFDNPGGKIDPIYLANKIFDFDLIVNLPKMKTHELTTITCAIKNMFGCVLGLHKVRYHMDAPIRKDFASALVDIVSFTKPSINIVDAVVSMEGQGPSHGKLRNSNLIIASTDIVAVDAVCSKVMQMDPFDIETTRIAYEKRLGEAHLDKIELIGDPLIETSQFISPKGITSILNKLPANLIRLLRPIINRIYARPKINRNKCIKCMTCVKSCPAKAIDSKSFKIDRKKCIMCFCCRELCKYNAVDMEKSFLYRLLESKRS